MDYAHTHNFPVCSVFMRGELCFTLYLFLSHSFEYDNNSCLLDDKELENDRILGGHNVGVKLGRYLSI